MYKEMIKRIDEKDEKKSSSLFMTFLLDLFVEILEFRLFSNPGRNTKYDRKFQNLYRESTNYYPESALLGNDIAEYSKDESEREISVRYMTGKITANDQNKTLEFFFILNSKENSATFYGKNKKENTEFIIRDLLTFFSMMTSSFLLYFLETFPKYDQVLKIIENKKAEFVSVITICGRLLSSFLKFGLIQELAYMDKEATWNKRIIKIKKIPKTISNEYKPNVKPLPMVLRICKTGYAEAKRISFKTVEKLTVDEICDLIQKM